MLEVSGLRVASGAMIRVDGLGSFAAGARLHRAAGPERRRQDRKRRGYQPALCRKAAGRVIFDGDDITHLEASSSRPPRTGACSAAARAVPELLGARDAAGRKPRRARPASAIPFDKVYDLFPRLAERRDQLAGSLSGGEQQMLAIGRALVTQSEGDAAR